MNPDYRPSNGFTLIELLAAIAVIAILFTLLLPAISSIRRTADSAADMANLRQIHAAWVLATNDNGGEVIVGSTNSGSRSQRHWPGKLADYLGIRFPTEEFSVYLDYDTLPEKTVLSPGGDYAAYENNRLKVGYGMNYLATGTYFSGGFTPAIRADGSSFGSTARLEDIHPQAIIFASGNGNWHLGASVADQAGTPLTTQGLSGVGVRASYGGRANFIRCDGSGFTDNVYPERKYWGINTDR